MAKKTKEAPLILEPSKLALLPTEQLTEREAYLFKVYSEARACVTGSMVELYKKLELDSFKFFHLLDSDIEFKTAIMRGLSDSRAERLLELEASLINLALGVTVEEERLWTAQRMVLL